MNERQGARSLASLLQANIHRLSLVAVVALLALHLLMCVTMRPARITLVELAGERTVTSVVVGSSEWIEGVRVGDQVREDWPDGAGMTILAGEFIVGVPLVWPPVSIVSWFLAAALVGLAVLLRALALPGALVALSVGGIVSQASLLGAITMPFALLVLPLPSIVATAATESDRRGARRLLWLVLATLVVTLPILGVAAEPVGLSWFWLWTASWLLPFGTAGVVAFSDAAAAVREWRRAPAHRRTLGALITEFAPSARRGTRVAAEEERDRLAVQVHQSILPQVHRSLQAVTSGESRASESELRKLEAGLRELLDEHQLTVLQVGGLAAAIQTLVADLLQKGIACETVVTGDPDARPPWEVEVALYRISQEALNNVWLHASADNVVVELRTAPNQVELAIVDDGIGFEDPEHAQTGREGHLGVREIYRRASEIGGRVEISPAAPSGTRVQVRWRR